MRNLLKVDNLLVICCLPLTSNQHTTEYRSEDDESEDVQILRKVIASLKIQIAELKSPTDNQISEDCLALPNELTSRANSCGDLGEGCIACDRLKSENSLLRELINEVKDKNQLLEEKNAKIRTSLEPTRCRLDTQTQSRRILETNQDKDAFSHC